MPHPRRLRKLAQAALALAVVALSSGQLYPPGPTAPLVPPRPTRQA